MEIKDLKIISEKELNEIVGGAKAMSESWKFNPETGEWFWEEDERKEY